MKQAILVDLHKTLIDENSKPNKIVIDSVKSLSDKYHILIFTANDMKDLKKEENKIISTGINYSGFYYELNNHDDVEKKLSILAEVQKKYEVKLLIDNNKHVCRKFKKLNIPVFRFMI